VENADVAAARAEFILAQALWSTREKRRARKLAQQAYQRFAALGHPYQGDADDVRRWIRAR
jgi:hypothetical protein